MKSIKAFVEGHQLLAFFALVFAVSWGGMLLVIGGPGAIPGSAEQTAGLFPAVYLITVAGPAAAGVILSGLTGGRAGLRGLGARLLRWRAGARWYAIALLIAPLTAVATLLALSPLSSGFVPGFLTASPKASLLRFGVLAGLGLATGLLEELGWTGFAVPKVRLRHGLFGTGLYVGLVWGGWHFLSNLWASGASSGVPLALFLPAILFSFLPPYRALMVWVYDRTGSLPVAIVMHASLVAFWLISMPRAIAGGALVGWYLAWAAALWMVVGAVALTQGRRQDRRLGGHLSQPAPRRTPPRTPPRRVA